MNVTGLKQSTIPDSGDVTLVQPSDWNTMRTLLGDAIPGGASVTAFAAGDVLYASGAAALSRLPIGAAGTILTSVGGVPAWVAGGVTEGTWTPTLTADGSASGQTYSTQVGEYSKIGRRVMFQGQIGLTAKGTLTGNLQIGGLPFTVTNSAADYGGITFGYWGNLASAIVYLSGYYNIGDTRFYLTTSVSGGTALGTVTAAQITDTLLIRFAGHYRAAS